METIITQIKQVANNLITKNVNTGDKIIDMAISVIILSLMDIMIKYIMTFSLSISSILNKELGENPWNFDPMKVEKISEEDVKKFKYTLEIQYSTCVKTSEDDIYFSDLVHNWINITFGEKCSRQNCLKHYLYATDNEFKNFGITPNNINNLKIKINKNDKNYIFMPIWAYKENGKINYIYIMNNSLWSNSIIELSKLIEHVGNISLDLHKNYTKSFFNKNNDLEIKELTESWASDKKDFVRGYKKIGIVNKNKTFDKIFFDEKEKLLEMIEKYTNKTLYPPGLGLDNKLGILLYGPPGTGKTGTIFCVANLLNKPILLINSLKLKKSTIISAINEAKKTYIIVLDEFDHLLQELKINDKTCGMFNENYNLNNQIIMKQKMICQMNKNNENEEDKQEITENTYRDIPNDVFLYKLLDSFGDDDGRIIIATTNNPNMVNPVLLRPGRFDMKLCLSYCSLNMFLNIARNVFDIDEYIKNSDNLEKINNVLKLNITPLVLINTLVLSKNLEECIVNLSKNKQKFYNKKPEENID